MMARKFATTTILRGVTAAPLVQRLRDLTPLQRLAVLHAVRRFFGRPEEDTAPVLRDVGLVR